MFYVIVLQLKGFFPCTPRVVFHLRHRNKESPNQLLKRKYFLNFFTECELYLMGTNVILSLSRPYTQTIAKLIK